MTLTLLLASTAMLWTHYVAWKLPEHTSRLSRYYWDTVPFDVGADARAREIRQMLDMGIDGMFIDVVFQQDHSPAHYGNFDPFLEGAKGTPFKVGICCDVRTDVDWQISELVRLLKSYASHSNYPKENGRAVVATYAWWAWTPEEWRRIREGVRAGGFEMYLIANVTFSYAKFSLEKIDSYKDCFDAMYNFGYMGLNGTSVEENNRLERVFCQKNGKRFIPGLHPGYLGAWLIGRNDYYLPSRHLDSLHECFLAARDGNFDEEPWFHLTSWNDHDESTVAPRVLTGGMRQLVRAYSDALKRLPPSAEEQDVVFAYHREEFPGTLVRIEAMRLPAKKGESVPLTVEGSLLDDQGGCVKRLEKKTLAKSFDRVEWLVPTVDLAKSPLLMPAFTTSSGRSARFSPIFFVDPWIQNQQTVKQTFASRAEARTGLSVTSKDGVLEAEAAYEGEDKLKRAVLYRNDRPLGTFALERTTAVCLVRDNAGNEVSDSIYDLKPLAIRKGRLFLSVKTDKAPSKSDAFWVRYETMKDAVVESRVKYPFATEDERRPVKTLVLETDVNLETTSGASGAPGARDCLTPCKSIPVRGSRVVEAEVSPLVDRTMRIDDSESFFGPNPKSRRVVLPHRAWPMTRAAISFEVKPSKGGARSLIAKSGWQAGFSFTVNEKNCLVATWSASKEDGCFELVSPKPLRLGEWNAVSLVYDLRTAWLEVNGAETRKAIPARRVFGNCTVMFGRDPIRNFRAGSRPDVAGATDTAKIQGRIDDAAARGGGEVRVEKGIYQCGSLFLKSGVTLRLDRDAKIVASTRIQDYLPVNGEYALINACGQRDVSVVGEGTVDGSGSREPLTGTLPFRRKVFQFVDCTNVTLKGLTVNGGTAWTCFFNAVEGAHVDRLTLRCRVNHNNDGFDIRARNVLIENCDLDCSDDAIVIKNRREWEPSDFVVENVEIRNCLVSGEVNAFKIGTETSGDVRNVLVQDLVVTNRGVNKIHKWLPKRLAEDFKPGAPRQDGLVLHGWWSDDTAPFDRGTICPVSIESVDGATVENVTVRNVTFSDAVAPLYIRLAARNCGNLDGRRGVLRNVLVENMKGCYKGRFPVQVTGLPGLRPKDITFRNLELVGPGGPALADTGSAVPECETMYPECENFYHYLPAWGVYARHVDGLKMENCEFSTALPDVGREKIVLDDVL